MASTFGYARNTFKTTLGVAHTAADGQLVLATGAGAALGALPANRIYRVVALRNAGTPAEQILAIFEATGLSTDTLTGVTAAEATTDVNLAQGTSIHVRDTAGYFAEIQTAVNNIEGDGTIVRTSSTYNDPSFIVSLSASKLSGTKLSVGDAIGGSTSGSIPFFSAGVLAQDSSFSWDSTGKTFIQKGQAAGSGGNRWQLQDNAGGNFILVDPSGTVVYDMAVHSGTSIHRANPAQSSSDDDVFWSETLVSFPNSDGPPNSVNQVGSIGHNDFQATTHDSTKISFRDGWEYRWWSGTRYQSERHIGAIVWPDDLSFELRPITISIYHDTRQVGWTCAADTVIFQDSTNPGNIISEMMWDKTTGSTGVANGKGTLTQAWSIFGTSGAGFTLSPTGDSFGVGRVGAPVAVTFTGTTAQYSLVGDTAEWTSIVQSGSHDLELQLNGVGGVVAFSGTAGSIGQVFLTAPAAQASGAGFQLAAGSGKQGYVTLDSSGNILLVQDGAGRLYLGNTFTAYVDTSGYINAAKMSIPINLSNMTIGAGGAAQINDVGGGNVQALSQAIWTTDCATFWVRTANGASTRLSIDGSGAAFLGPIGVNGSAPPAKAASPGTATGTDATVVNAIVTILRNLGFCS